MSSVTKLCADHLRAFSNNRGIKLKSGHAHELVAAFLGYKSKAAMLADALYPIENLAKTQLIVLMPSLFIEQRRKCLQDLPPDLPGTDELCEGLTAFLEQKVSCKFFASWQHLAEVNTTQYLKKHSDRILPAYIRLRDAKASDIFNKSLNEFNPKIETTDSGVKLIVDSEYRGSHDGRHHLKSIVVRIVIKLQRIASYVGYTITDVSLIDCSIQSFIQTGALR